jgi:hypothetical protein
MPIQHHVMRDGASILLAIGLDNAVLDVVTSDALLHECLKLLDTPHRGLVHCPLGTFGDLPVTLNLFNNDDVAIIVDGPYFDPARNLACGIWLEKEEAKAILAAALQK